MKVGLTGLGVIDRPMVKDLVKAGHELYVNDFHKEAVDDLVARGATAITNAKEAALVSELVITMLPNSPHVKTVILGGNGIIEDAYEGFVYVDMSSIAPFVSHEVHDELVKVGILMLDASVSGGGPKMIGGTLVVVVGGDKAVFKQVVPVLDVMTGSVIYVGAIGVGDIAKLADQTIIAANIAACAEASALTQKAGVNPETTFRTIRGGFIGSAAMDAKVSVILARNFAPGSRTNLHIKDLNNALDTDYGVDSPLPLTVTVRDMTSVLQGDDFDTDDRSGLLKYYGKLSDIELRPNESEG